MESVDESTIDQETSNASLHHVMILSNQTLPMGIPARATSERIPTSTWGPFTIVIIVFLVLLTCLIINCSRIQRKVDEKRMDKLGRSGRFSFEKRHKDLQEADLEWNNHPPIVFTNEKISTPESTYSSKHSYSSGTWSTANSTIAQQHHYHDKNFIKKQPPSVQLRLTLENASASSLISSKRPMIPNGSSFASSNAASSSTLDSEEIFHTVNLDSKTSSS